MGAKKPDDIILTTDGVYCDVVKHIPTQLNNPITIRYIADITLWDNDDFDIDFSFRNNRRFQYPKDIVYEVYLFETKALLKKSLIESQITNDGFLKNLFRSFFSEYFEIHELDLLIRVNYDEENRPETLFITFNVEYDTLLEKLEHVDGYFCAYLYDRCLVKDIGCSNNNLTQRSFFDEFI